MKFVQTIDFETERLDEMEQLLQEAGQRSAGRTGGPTHRTLLKDRDHPNRYLALIEFESQRLGALCIGERRYTNCDLLDARDLG
jgi:hypothetical protein